MEVTKWLKPSGKRATNWWQRECAGRTTLATAWSMNFDFVASTIIGARDAEQLDDTLAALDVTLSADVLAACDAVHKAIPYPMG